MKKILFCFGFVLFLTSCKPGALNPSNPQHYAIPLVPTVTPFQPLPYESPPPKQEAIGTDLDSLASNNLDNQTFKIWVSPSFPGQLELQPIFSLVDDEAHADLKIQPGDDLILSKWIYCLVAPFPETLENISFERLKNIWKGKDRFSPSSPQFILSTATFTALQQIFGDPAEGIVQLVNSNEVLGAAWENRPAFSIVPFEELNPKWKVIAIDNQSPISNQFSVNDYPLVITFSLNGPRGLVNSIIALYGPESTIPIVPNINRRPEKLTVVAVTGVTALVRATAFTMEQQGIEYPAKDIGKWLQESDLTHISNEVPFAQNCPFPNPVQPDVVFCSSPKYLDLLKYVGTDIVELTGDHFHDWGSEAMLYTLELYDQASMLYYGGGANYSEGQQPVLLEHNGNRLVFIGCNGKRGGFAQASANTPGSVACDIPWMVNEISRLKDTGYLVIATFQHFEYYAYDIPEETKTDFRAVAEAGAVVVSGSQAHHPHGFEFLGSSLIHYGLGNLFFDQYLVSAGTREGFIDRHVIYNGKYISTELLTLVFEDFARSRPMNESERITLLKNVFTASKW